MIISDELKEMLLSNDVADFDLAVAILQGRSYEIGTIQKAIQDLYKEYNPMYIVYFIPTSNTLIRTSVSIYDRNNGIFIKDPNRMLKVITK